MAIDIRFLRQLPSSFIDQDTQDGEAGLFRFLRNADADRNGELTREEIRTALPRGNQSDYDLDLTAQRAERDIAASCDFIRTSLREGQVSLSSQSPEVHLFAPRNPLIRSYTWNHPHFDRDRNGRIDRSEVLAHLSNSTNPRLEALEDALRRTASGLHQMEAHSEHRGLMNLLNLGTRPFLWLASGISSMIHSSPRASSLHEQIRIYAGQRHEIRLAALARFMERMRAHPEQSIQDTLEALNAQDRSILIDDLQVQNWQYVLTASNASEGIDAHLQMAENLMRGADSTNMLGGMSTLDEFLVVPWRAENYAMANNVIRALEDRDDLSASQRERVRELRSRIQSTNLGGVLELPRPDSLNENWDFMATLAVEFLLLKGGLKAVRWGRAALGGLLGGLGARIAALWGASAGATSTGAACSLGGASATASSGIMASGALCTSGVCTAAPVAAATCANAVSRIPESGWRQGWAYAAAGLGYAARGFGKLMETLSMAGGTALAANAALPPERHANQTDFAFHLAEPDLNNEWVNANLASLALAVFQAEHPAD